ncbi:hypothetical protein [Nitrosomonas sp. HPC101]|uniref:hypothetical protein n=1 Tax=Nitrosomonas sp. HPC101 TaxID=1658667 RepID=UPI001370AEFB|nr:hypothetical protein [Nitrosomonas sp. HPC101]
MTSKQGLETGSRFMSAMLNRVRHKRYSKAAPGKSQILPKRPEGAWLPFVI